MSLDKTNEVAREYYKLTQQQLALATQRLYANWRESFNARKYDEAAKLYRQIIEAYQRGEVIPGDIQKIQQRLTFISSNRP